MNGILLTLAIAFATIPSGIPVWTADYGNALKKARAADRPLLVVLDDPASPDQRLDQILDRSQSELLEKFELCRVDVTTEYGKKIATVFRATEFPYTVVTDRAAQRVLLRRVGRITAPDWERLLREYSNPQRTVTQVASTSADQFSSASGQGGTVSRSIGTSQPLGLAPTTFSAPYANPAPSFAAPQSAPASGTCFT